MKMNKKLQEEGDLEFYEGEDKWVEPKHFSKALRSGSFADFVFKVVLLGDTQAGKTSVV